MVIEDIPSSSNPKEPHHERSKATRPLQLCQLPGPNLHLWLPPAGSRCMQLRRELRLRQDLLLRQGLCLRQELMPDSSRGASGGTPQP